MAEPLRAEFPPARSASPTVHSAKAVGVSGLGRMQDSAFWALLAMLVWAPLPLASNRAWALSLLAMALCTLLLAVLLSNWLAACAAAGSSRGTSTQDAGKRSQSAVWAWPLGLLAAHAALVASQLLPLGDTLVSLLAPGDEGLRTISVDPFSTRLYLLACLGYLAGFWLVLLLVKNEKRLRWLALAVVTSGALQAILATYLMSKREGYEFLLLPFPPGDRAMGTFANTDHLAGYMHLCLAMGLGLLLGSVDGEGRAPVGWRQNLVAFLHFMMSKKMLLRLVLVTMVIALVLTRSRGGNAAFLLALLLTGALCAWRSPKLRRMATILVLSMLVVDLLVVGQWVGLDKVVQRLEGTSVQQPKPGADAAVAATGVARPSASREESLEERLVAARYALAMVNERPWLGFGGGTFYTAFPRFKGEHPLGFYDHAHNDYVEVASDTGLLGLALLLALALSAFCRTLRALGDHSPPLTRGMAAGVLMAIMSMGIHSVVDFNLQVPANALSFAVVLALAWCLPGKRALHRRRGSAGSKPGAEHE